MTRRHSPAAQRASSVQRARQPITKPETLYHEGLQALKRGDLVQAQHLIGQVVARHPDNAALRDNMGTLLQMRGRPADAEAEHRNALRLQPQFPEARFNLGNALRQQNRLEEAREAYEDALSLKPDYPEALCNLAVTLRQLNDPATSARHYRHALRLRPDFAAALGGLADTATMLKLYSEAEEMCRRLLRLQPNSVHALANLGNALRHQDHLDEAETVYRKALKLQPDAIDVLNNLGAVLHRLGRQEEAGTYFARVLELSPDHADAHNNLANSLLLQKRMSDAIVHYERAIELRPAYAEAHSNLGSALQSLGRLEDAARAYCRAIELKPELPDGHSNLGTLYTLLGMMPEAALCFQRALALRADYPEASNNLGNVLQWDARLDEAIAQYEKAIELRPEFAGAHMNLGMALLGMGEFRRGWAEYEWRWSSEQFSHARRPFPQPQWAGEDAAGKTILIHAEQGFGDTLQFCRFAPMAAERGLTVILEVQRPLVRLLGCLPGIHQVVAQGDPLPEFDLHCPMLSLPGALDITIDTLPAARPYLVPDADLVAKWAPRISDAAQGRLRVGLVWSGSPRTYSQDLAAVDRRRSMGWAKMAPVAECEGIAFFCLQKDGERPPAEAGLIDVMGEVGDFGDTAAIMANLDLLISVDTAMVHLAGGMGLPVWVLNRFDSCWRWLRDRDDSPWYRNARLFRQPKPGDWETVTRRVRNTLTRAVITGENLVGGPAGGIPSASATIPAEELFAQAIAHHRDGRLDQAIDLYRQVVTRRPDDVVPYLNIGLAQLGQGRQDDALATFRWAVTAHPDCPEAQVNLAVALAGRGRHAEALEAFDRAIALRPALAEAYNNRAMCLRSLGRLDDAITDFRRAAELEPNSPQPRHNLEKALRERSERLEAESLA